MGHVSVGISRFVSSATAPGRCGSMKSERHQIVREIAMFPGHLTIAAACLMMDAAVEVPPALIESIKAFNDALAPVLCDEKENGGGHKVRRGPGHPRFACTARRGGGTVAGTCAQAALGQLGPLARRSQAIGTRRILALPTPTGCWRVAMDRCLKP